jgi:RNA polymerase sigma-70 factor (ECF subfamily)
MTDSTQNSDADLEKFRGYLGFLARMHVGKHLNGKADLSGIVQQTMLEAHQNRSRWQTLSSQDQIAYLRRILANNIQDEVRKFSAGKRDALREQSLEQEFEKSSICLMNWIAADVSSPSMRLNREERALRLTAALDRLPEAQREALVLQHWEGKSLAEIAVRMQRTTVAVAGLIKRGLRQLREELNPADQ